MVVTTLAGAVVGALVGSLGTYILQGQRRIRQQQNEIDNLRNSLLAELSNMDDLLPSDYDGKIDTVPIGMSIPSNIYLSNTQNLSILTQHETNAVIRFYSGALKLQKMSEKKQIFYQMMMCHRKILLMNKAGKTISVKHGSDAWWPFLKIQIFIQTRSNLKGEK